MKPPVLSASFRLSLPAFRMAFDLTLHHGVTAILGPSGSGKTTFLEILAGLRDSQEAVIRLGDRFLDNSDKGFRLPPESRRLGYLPQEILLFPHLNVADNITYGSKTSGASPGLDLSTVVGILEIGHLLKTMPGRLSGGEKQRVGLARALLSGPEMILLDEPLSALDGGLKGRVLPYLRRIREQFRIPIVYVTHDLSDILALAEDVVVVEKGCVVLQGEPSEILRKAVQRPIWEGMPLENRVEGIVGSHDETKGLTSIQVGDGSLWIPRFHAETGTRVRVSFSAEDVLVSTQPVVGLSARNVFSGHVESLVSDGTDLLGVRAFFPILVRLTKGAVAELGIQVGSEVHLILKSGSIRCEAFRFP